MDKKETKTTKKVTKKVAVKTAQKGKSGRAGENANRQQAETKNTATPTQEKRTHLPRRRTPQNGNCPSETHG